MQRATTHCFGAELDEEVLEVAAGEQLEHDVARQLLEADADEGDDVGVLELAHDERLHQEVHLGLLGAQLGQRLPNTPPARRGALGDNHDTCLHVTCFKSNCAIH